MEHIGKVGVEHRSRGWKNYAYITSMCAYCESNNGENELLSACGNWPLMVIMTIGMVLVLITKMTYMQSEWKTYGTYEEKQYFSLLKLVRWLDRLAQRGTRLIFCCHMNSICLEGNSDKWRGYDDLNVVEASQTRISISTSPTYASSVHF